MNNEFVKQQCQHKDCIYRQYIEGGHVPICGYASVQGKSRGCSISECDKYTPGRKVKPKMRQDAVIVWEYDIYDKKSTTNIIR